MIVVTPTSSDGGLTLDPPGVADDGGQIQIRTGTQMAMVHYGARNGRDIGLMIGPGDIASRLVATIWATSNDGRSWIRQPFRQGYCGYSAGVVMDDGTLVAALETGAGFPGNITIAEIAVGYPLA